MAKLQRWCIHWVVSPRPDRVPIISMRFGWLFDHTAACQIRSLHSLTNADDASIYYRNSNRLLKLRYIETAWLGKLICQTFDGERVILKPWML